jgi:heme/copper-type cytochrome/quinol oxidase subunit 4
MIFKPHYYLYAVPFTFVSQCMFFAYNNARWVFLMGICQTYLILAYFISMAYYVKLLNDPKKEQEIIQK